MTTISVSLIDILPAAINFCLFSLGPRLGGLAGAQGISGSLVVAVLLAAVWRLQSLRTIRQPILFSAAPAESAVVSAPSDYIAGFPSIPLQGVRSRRLSRLAKRALDLLFSAFLIAATAPVWLLIAIAIRLESPGPVFYVASRTGRHGRIFRCFKFRTMVAGADRLRHSLTGSNDRDSILFKMRNDPRITPLGRLLRKYSFDELPQLLNVLRGEMSMVGPRPALPEEVARYQALHRRRLEVLPGLTGLWQVQARQHPSFDRYIALDLEYVDTWSIWLDLKVLAQTVAVVLRGTGV